jgi:hypothetical protein
MTDTPEFHEITAVAVQRFEEAIGWRAGMDRRSDGAVPLAYLSHVGRAPVDVTRDLRPEPLFPELGNKGVNGGGSVHPGAPVSVGTLLCRMTTIEERYTKPGASGPMEFVVVRHSFRTPDGETAADARTWMIYR